MECRNLPLLGLGWAGLGLLLQGLMVRSGKKKHSSCEKVRNISRPTRGGGGLYLTQYQPNTPQPLQGSLLLAISVILEQHWIVGILYCTVLYMYLAGRLGRYGAPGPLGPNKQAVGTAPVFNLLNVDLWVDGMVGRLDGWMDGWMDGA